ncbi:MAG: hypothetical protein H9855_03645 [Candidatus Acinetobacter avistercoris]|uniref:hypothetical protein n=1 Tax=Acinetobacter sp. KS-LM10 TaxID=3120518 RepID=UPI001F9926D5|nr:hypothetical protein [Candidatus Acinetobacter avistercoris]
MKSEELLKSNSEWDVKETITVYENYNSVNDEELLVRKASNGHLGAQLVALKLRQDDEMERNLPVNLNVNEFYDLGLKGQPLAASYAASSIDEVDEVKAIKNIDEVIKVQLKLIQTSILEGGLGNFPFYVSLLLLKENESSKIDNDWVIDKKNVSKLSNQELQNIVNMNKYLAKVGYDITPIYFMQMYYFGYGVNKDFVESCAWAKNVDQTLINRELINLIKKIESEKLSTEQEIQCKALTERYKDYLKHDYANWLQRDSIVYKSQAQKILDEYNIKF